MVTHSSRRLSERLGQLCLPPPAPRSAIHLHCLHSLFVAHSCFVASTTAHLWPNLYEDNKKEEVTGVSILFSRNVDLYTK